MEKEPQDLEDNMEVILVRHAKAEPWQPGQTDFDRALIQEGIERLQNKLPDLQEELATSLFEDPDHPRRLVMWASPSVRAMETADLIREVLDVDEIEEHEWIWEQDSVEFENSLNELEENDLIVIVGHQPSLSIWAEIMTGHPISFRTSAIYSFVKQEGQRTWYVNWELP